MLDGKTCFITGGAQGIGLGIAKACAARGAQLVLADMNTAALDAARLALEGTTTVRTVELDVTDRERFGAVADEVEADLGPVYALFNNAGIIDSVSPIAMRGEVWDWMVNVNLNGVYNGIQAFVPRMIKRGEGGFIVNTSSVAGLAAAGSGFAYHATKFAVVGLSESLRQELSHHNISVSVVCPGQVATSIVKNAQSMRPTGAEQPTTRVKAILDKAHESLLTNGISIEEAGRAVVDGTLAGQPFIFTDGNPFYRSMVEHRTAQILDCFPAEAGEPLSAVAAEGA